MPQQTVPRLESLHIKNYRALRDVKLKQIRSLSVFLGANGSGKSTIFDVFALLIGTNKVLQSANAPRICLA